MLFSDPGNSEIWKSGIWNQDTLCNWEIRNSSHVLQNTAQQVIWEFGKSGHFRTFFSGNVTNLQKSAKKCKKKRKKKKSVPKTPWNFGFLSKVAICRSIEKVSKWHRNPRAHLCIFFPKFPRGILGFSTFNLESEVRRFRRFGKIFTFAFYRLEVDGPIFYMGRKSELRFFSKSAEHVFGFGSDFVLLSRKSVRTKMTTPTDYPIGPLLRRGSVFLTLFVQIPGCEMASKKKVNGFAVLLYRIWEESM
jgi:hypothetical protein